MEPSAWMPIKTGPPAGEQLLIWVDGGCALAVMVEGSDSKGPWRVFMDPRSDEILPWPTHWMALPSAPE